ncbi:MAG: hypothetical protein H7296_08015 [Bacteroidia bacterium]|nr:hypothetical protein [Bacteroidia bacterium]
MTQLAIEYVHSSQSSAKSQSYVYRDDMRTYSTAELINCIIGSGGAEMVASVNHCLFELGRKNAYDLMRIRGVTKRKALMILAALELGKRRRDEGDPISRIIRRSSDTFAILSPYLSDIPYEEFWILCLKRNNAVISAVRISAGGMEGTVADSKIIFRISLEHKACSIVLCHNHPSLNVQPSNCDVMLTKKLLEAGRVMDIHIYDHLIIGGNTYFSFADEGLMR